MDTNIQPEDSNNQSKGFFSILGELFTKLMAWLKIDSHNRIKKFMEIKVND